MSKRKASEDVANVNLKFSPTVDGKIKKSKKRKSLGTEKQADPGLRYEEDDLIRKQLHELRTAKEKEERIRDSEQWKRKMKKGNTPMGIQKGPVFCEDLVVGTGPEAKQGKMVAIYYEVRLQNEHKVFDKTCKGHPFKFRLGLGEVNKVWDIGVSGMKIGGKRRVFCPPDMAYGKKEAPPEVTKNVTLEFVIELIG